MPLTDPPQPEFPDAAWPGRDLSGLPTWDERILALMPPSIDVTQIAEDLRLTPTQRLEKLQSLVDSVAAFRRGKR